MKIISAIAVVSIAMTSSAALAQMPGVDSINPQVIVAQLQAINQSAKGATGAAAADNALLGETIQIRILLAQLLAKDAAATAERVSMCYYSDKQFSEGAVYSVDGTTLVCQREQFAAEGKLPAATWAVIPSAPRRPKENR